jgi:predicted component of type VI protein secretion system
VAGFARGVFIVLMVISCCCCTAIVAGIAACVYCCVKGSSSPPLPAGVPGAYQTNPALQQQAQQANTMQVLPGTLQMTSVAPTNTIPAETGLATSSYQPAYQPGYQPQQQYQPQQYIPSQQQQQADIPFAQALSVNADGTPTQKY